MELSYARKQKNRPFSWQDEAVGFMVNNDLIKPADIHIIILGVTKNNNVFTNNLPTWPK